MSKFLAIAAVAAMAIGGSSTAFAGGGHFAIGHGGGFGGHGFGGHGFGGPVIGLGFAPGYYGYGSDYGYDPGCYALQRVWTGRRWVMRQIQVC